MTDFLKIIFWFLTIPYITYDQTFNSGSFTLFHAVVFSVVLILGFICGFWVFVGVSVLFKVLVLILVYLLGLFLTMKTIEESDFEWKWILSLFLSGFFLSPFLHWLWMLR